MVITIQRSVGFFDALDRLRQKPVTTRRTVARTVAVIILLIILGLWFGYSRWYSGTVPGEVEYDEVSA